MRIIGGEFRGRKIRQPGTGAVRPTKDRIREAVFNIVAAEVPGAKVLDIFSGSGAYGLEAVSRGAEKAVLVESDRSSAGTISENVRALGVGDKVRTEVADAFETVESLSEDKERFDLVFADPPFGKGLAKKTLLIINQYDILFPSGLLIIEHHAEECLPETEGNLSVYKKKTYGDILISVYSRK